MKKTANFNLIILDESGSMSSCFRSTISGCNETLNVVRQLHKEFNDANDYFVSIYAFQDGSVPSRYICKNKRISEVNDITEKDYCPGGLTPLLDAVGSTLTDLEMVADTHEDATGIITIITDGYENSSRNYTYPQVAAIISRFKEQGWTVNFIGANIDVEKVSASLNIDKTNCVAWESDEEGTKEMYSKLNACTMASERERIYEESAAPEMSRKEKVLLRKRSSSKFFNR